HETYGKRWKLTPQQMARVPMAPTNYAYTRHMLHIAQNGSALDATVVALPCAWIYCVVGQHLLRKGKPPKSHPYRDWLLVYAPPGSHAPPPQLFEAHSHDWGRGKEEVAGVASTGVTRPSPNLVKGAAKWDCLKSGVRRH